MGGASAIGFGKPERVVAQVEGRSFLVAHGEAAADSIQRLEVVLAVRTRCEQDQHRGRLPRLVAEAVDPALRDEQEVTRADFLSSSNSKPREDNFSFKVSSCASVAGLDNSTSPS